MSYRTEKLFSNALCKMLKLHCTIVQRIESGTTGRGIPDIYTRWPKCELWIEVKNDLRQSVHQQEYTVAWRPGQKGWMYQYHKTSGAYCITIMALKDGFIIVPMNQTFNNNIVAKTYCYCTSEFTDIWPIIRKEVYDVEN